MIDKVLHKISSKRKFIYYILLNYIDKLIIFILPLLVLYITKSKSEYNLIEYIFSIAAIIIPILGIITSYSFYGYRIADDRKEYIKNLKGYFFSLQLLYVFFSLILYLVLVFGGISQSILYVYIFVSIRSLFLLLINFLNAYYRLVDKPSLVFLYSIPVNLLSLLLVSFISLFEVSFIIETFFLPQILIVIFTLIYFFILRKRNFFKSLLVFMKKCLIYSSPVIINTLLISFINNYGKIYAFNFLTDYDMYSFSYIMRLNMVIIMAHSSLLAFYSKAIFIDNSRGISNKIIIVYSSLILLSTFATILGLVIFNMLPQFDKINIDLSFWLIILYTILHCVSSFIEILYNRKNKQYYFIFFSIVSCSVYLFLIYIVGVVGLMSLSLYMVAFILVYLLMEIYFLRKI